jgi:hypothetical protein
MPFAYFDMKNWKFSFMPKDFILFNSDRKLSVSVSVSAEILV